jgi:hypothetical protein
MDTLYEPQNGGSMVPMSTPGFIRVGMVDSLFHKSVFSLIDNVAIIHYLKGLNGAHNMMTHHQQYTIAVSSF